MNKKYIAALLCIVVVFMTSVSAYAGGNDTDRIPLTTKKTTTTTTTTQAPVEEADKSVLQAVLNMSSNYSADDYSDESYQILEGAFDSGRNVLNASTPTQKNVDMAVTDIVSAITALVPYLNLEIVSNQSNVTVSYNEEEFNDLAYSILYGTEINLYAEDIEDYNFVGWFDTVSNRYVSYEQQYTFVISTNLKLEAKFSKTTSATLNFANQSGQVVERKTLPISQWKIRQDISSILPDVPYSYSGTNGRWEYDNSKVLAELRNGNDVTIYAVYDEIDADDVTIENNTDIPVGKLSFNYKDESKMGSFIMNINIPEECQVNSIGVAFKYGDSSFAPQNIILTLNNKNVVSQFNTENLESTYIVNTPTSIHNWAAVGYVTYFDADGILTTYYTNQINVVDNQVVE